MFLIISESLFSLAMDIDLILDPRTADTGVAELLELIERTW